MEIQCVPGMRGLNLPSTALALTVLATGCGGSETPPAAPAAPAVEFFKAVSALCGQAFAGRIIANEPAQPGDPMAGQPLVMHVLTCEPERLRIPFQVGADRSRTWVLTLHGDRIRLKHDHRHEDGSEDLITQYGGDSVDAGLPTRQTFPVDVFSKELFTRANRAVSNTNVWAMEVHPGRSFAYELTRPGRRFRVEFDLASPVPAPPPPWGS